MQKHTSGKVIFEQTTRVDTALDKFIRTEDDYPIAWAYETANAKLICEAFNVTNETGKSPRQLADENKELLKAHHHLVGVQKEFGTDSNNRQILRVEQKDWKLILEAINKATK